MSINPQWKLLIQEGHLHKMIHLRGQGPTEEDIARAKTDLYSDAVPVEMKLECDELIHQHVQELEELCEEHARQKECNEYYAIENYMKKHPECEEWQCEWLEVLHGKNDPDDFLKQMKILLKQRYFELIRGKLDQALRAEEKAARQKMNRELEERISNELAFRDQVEKDAAMLAMLE